MKDLLLEEEVTGSSPDTEAAGLRKIEHHNAPLWYNLQIYTIAGRLVRALWINICQLRFGDSSINHISSASQSDLLSSVYVRNVVKSGKTQNRT